MQKMVVREIMKDILTRPLIVCTFKEKLCRMCIEEINDTRCIVTGQKIKKMVTCPIEYASD